MNCYLERLSDISNHLRDCLVSGAIAQQIAFRVEGAFARWAADHTTPAPCATPHVMGLASHRKAFA